MIQFTIKKAEPGKYILERQGRLPEVYDTLTALVVDLYVSQISREFSGNEITISSELIFNPPQVMEQ